MSKIEKIEKDIQSLSAQDLAELRAWFMRFDADAWDRQIETDARAGRLDGPAAEALRDHRAGKSTPL